MARRVTTQQRRHMCLVIKVKIRISVAVRLHQCYTKIAKLALSHVLIQTTKFLITDSVRGVTIPDSCEDDDTETQAATVDFSFNEDSTIPSIAAAAAENSETETKFSSSMAASDDTLNHLQSGKHLAKQYSKFNVLSDSVI